MQKKMLLRTYVSLLFLVGLNGLLCPQEVSSGWSVCQSQSIAIRPAVPAARPGHAGGAGLVLGPAGDHPDAPLSQRNGLQQGT